MVDDSNIVVCKNKLSNIIKKKPDSSIVKSDYANIDQGRFLEIINDVVYRTNKIVFHTYNFLKLYILHLHQQSIMFPIIDNDFIYIIMKTLSERTETRG